MLGRSKNKLETQEGWDAVETNQTTYELIQRIERTATGFEEHKQGTYNLVQSKKRLFLHTQWDESIGDYVRHHRGLWSTAEAFGACPGLHVGVMAPWLKDVDWANNNSNLTND